MAPALMGLMGKYEFQAKDVNHKKQGMKSKHVGQVGINGHHKKVIFVMIFTECNWI